MKVLLDTHLLIWAAGNSSRLPVAAIELLEREDVEPFFSAASLWEIAIKRGLGRADFQLDPRVLRRSLLEHNYFELPIVGDHVVAVDGLPPIHKDPFDRLLVAQAMATGIELLTVDRLVASYPGPIRLL